MVGLIEKISKLADEKKINEITIASDEGLPLVSTSKNAERVSAKGIDEIQKRLLGSDMNYITIVDKQGMKFLYRDRGSLFSYIIRSRNIIDEKTMRLFGEIIIENMIKEEKKRDIREEETLREKEERQARVEEAKKEKEERQARVEEAKKEKEERQARVEEAKKEKEERQARVEEIKREKEERQARVEEVKKGKEERQARVEEVKKEKEERQARVEEAKKEKRKSPRDRRKRGGAKKKKERIMVR